MSVSEEKALSEPKRRQNGPHFFKCLLIQLQIWSPKMKSDYAVQYFSLLPLDKHPTCLRLKFLIFFEKKRDKNAVTFEPIMQLSCSSRFRILKTLPTHSVL